MLDGVMLLWFLLTALSLLFVVVDIRATPAFPVLKWGFILLTGVHPRCRALAKIQGKHKSTSWEIVPWLSTSQRSCS